MLGLYLFVFGVIFGGKFGVIKNENFFDFALALFLGITLFQVLADTISSSPVLIVNQPNFVKKVVFPLEIISISQVISSLYFATLSTLICIILSPLSHGGLTAQSLLLPVIILPLAIISLGLSWLLSSLGVFIRDLNHTTSFIATALMYSSAIVYSLARIPESIAKILKYNPLVIIIDQARDCILWQKSINCTDLYYTYSTASVILLIGYYFFNRLRPYFAEVL